jgi:hypothetical protein
MCIETLCPPDRANAGESPFSAIYTRSGNDLAAISCGPSGRCGFLPVHRAEALCFVRPGFQPGIRVQKISGNGVSAIDPMIPILPLPPIVCHPIGSGLKARRRDNRRWRIIGCHPTDSGLKARRKDNWRWRIIICHPTDSGLKARPHKAQGFSPVSRRRTGCGLKGRAPRRLGWIVEYPEGDFQRKGAKAQRKTTERN